MLPISFDEFMAMSQQFLELVEVAFGGKFKIELKAMNRVKLSTFGRREAAIMTFVAETNRNQTFLLTDDLAAVTASVFNSAAYIEMTCTPVDTDPSLPRAWAHVEFKGYKPKQATFCVYPDADSGARKMKALHRFKIIGRGLNGNASAMDEKS
jgi:hypothetical protein